MCFFNKPKNSISWLIIINWSLEFYSIWIMELIDSAKFYMWLRSKFVVGSSRVNIWVEAENASAKAILMIKEASTFCPMEHRPFISIMWPFFCIIILYPNPLFFFSITELILINSISLAWYTSCQISNNILFIWSIFSLWRRFVARSIAFIVVCISAIMLQIALYLSNLVRYKGSYSMYLEWIDFFSSIFDVNFAYSTSSLFFLCSSSLFSFL